jgi:predicted nucleic acid-binding Zn ribbon protein
MHNEKRAGSYPKPMKNIVQTLLAQWTKKVVKNDFFYASVWKEAVGERVCKHTVIEKIVREKMFVSVENSIWMNELTFLKDKIKINVNKEISKNGIHIEEIIFKIGKIRKISE